MDRDFYFMKLAISLAKAAYKKAEVPVGAVIVKENQVIAKGLNLRESKNSPLAHAELIAIEKAAKKLKSWRLLNCEIYVTLEPCIMCAGAIIQARINRLIYGCSDPKGGAAGSTINIFSLPNLNHYVSITKGILAYECNELLKSFFNNLRRDG